MKAVVFAGPTVAAADIHKAIDAVVLPPVAQGDIYRVARGNPSAIGIVDGYFDGVPSVWHKEILWAIEQGIAVFGSASMGALRAAELSDFGMIGVGAIFEAYRDGEVCDDDEVAVLHGPSELGFVTLSEPMVSVRATVKSARIEKVLTAGTADLMISTAKALHYRDRTWAELVARLQGETGMAEFSEWLPDGRVDAKREDALAMLAEMASFLNRDGNTEKPQAHRVERTLVWNSLVRRMDAENGTRSTDAKAVLEELRLDPREYAIFRDRAALRDLALDEAERSGLDVGRDALIRVMGGHRSQQRLAQRDALLRWLAENDLDEESYEGLLREAVLVEGVLAARSGRLNHHMVADLSWSGGYRDLKKRAEAKARVIDQPGPARASPDRLRILIWYFEERLDRSVPNDLDDYAVSIGLADREELFALIGREFVYSSSLGDQGGAKATS